METLRLVKSGAGSYQQTTAETQEPILDIVNNFLNYSGINFDFLMQWLGNTRYSTLCNNNCTFIKLSDRVIISSCPLVHENVEESEAEVKNEMSTKMDEHSSGATKASGEADKDAQMCGGTYIDISYGKFVRLIDQFRKIADEQPEEIIITRYEGDICIDCK